MEFCDSLVSLTPLKSKMAAKFRWKTGWPGNARTETSENDSNKIKAVLEMLWQIVRTVRGIL